MRATIEKETLTLRFSRRLQASPERVFDAWTKPEIVAEWWDPAGRRLEACQIDLRVGGSFSFQNPNAQHPFTGTYVRIEPPNLLVFEAMGAVGTVLIEAAGAETQMQVSLRCASQDHLEQFVQMGIAAGTDRTLDNLVNHLAQGSATDTASP